jgi:hypothetical protein
MQTRVLSVMIYEALKAKGAELGNAAIYIIEQAIEEYEAFQPSAKAAAALAADGERGADMLPAPACCASFVYDGTHHKDCRFFRP